MATMRAIVSRFGRFSASSRSVRAGVCDRCRSCRKACSVGLTDRPGARPLLANTVPSPAKEMSPGAPPGASSGESSRGQEAPGPAEDRLAREDDRFVGLDLGRHDEAVGAQNDTRRVPRSCTSATASPSNAARRPFS